MTPTYETLFACVYANMFACVVRNVRYKFRKVRNNVAGKDASMLEQQFEDFEQQNGEIIRHKINPKVLSKNEIG